ncbi:pyridoxamine 5'-phosphate oxidase [Rheinheimera sp. SA_1]|uniref:pyridoxine/pyridoxamine 5'-phosphate oxidase n=1 Tax=Rheinheimera sp. SA_1 TaxID=1827365 RepID=UPI0007FC217B|nr:pyridoxal 5'-phosphate synthase [Rheinheimera sp. SA_1]OBP14869.1 pyridoxamine 5'-phosphate oxidase [Rheinheimera sp. SA_1]
MEDPIVKFEGWWQQALVQSPLQQKNAVCVSTIDENGFPCGRFVDLKSVGTAGFVFCTYVDSAKGRHIQRDPRTAMTVWWDHVGYQVRVVGTATAITAADADRYWETRSRSAQLTTTAFQQSQPLAAEQELSSRLQEAADRFSAQQIPRPDQWGGFCIKPVAIEFLTFRESRLHLRELYKDLDGGWVKQLLQP